jgi:hypothetical protein
MRPTSTSSGCIGGQVVRGPNVRVPSRRWLSMHRIALDRAQLAFRKMAGFPLRSMSLCLGLLMAAMTVPVTPACAKERPVALGVSITGTYRSVGPTLDEFTEQTGRMPRIAMYYRDWNEGWSTALIDRRATRPILERGAIPMITWLPTLSTGNPIYQPSYSPASIAAGAYDPYIERAAREAAAFHHPIFIRFAHEMNGSWSSWGAGVDGNTPADYVAMWRHVVSIFRAAGATNVRWVWSPNVYSNNSVAVPFQPYYPGNKWVDYVGLDGYNWGAVNGSGWCSFLNVFSSSYNQITKLTNKPVMITETASTELGGNKAAWIRAIPNALQTRMPTVRALIWFDQNKETDWSLNSSPESESAFRSIAQTPLFSGDVEQLLETSSPGRLTHLRHARAELRHRYDVANAG